jgi:NAD(P)H-hydrate epimerase
LSAVYTNKLVFISFMQNKYISQDLPTTLYSTEQVRELDRIAIQEHGIPGLTLMTRAGQDAFSLLEKLWPGAASVVVFCGSGNNAGDGYIVAREALLLAKQVSVITLSPTVNLQGDALSAYQQYLDFGGRVIGYHKDLEIDADVIVDALLGTGLARQLTGSYVDAVDLINQSHSPVMSLDIPSGLHADSGCVLGSAVKADSTITFIGLKKGLFTGQAADYCGAIYFSSLAVPDEIYQTINSNIKRIASVTIPKRQRCSHKGSYGHVLVVGGEQGYGGAARMAAEAAARSGAGLVSIATRSAHAGFIAISRPEIMCHGVESDTELEPLLSCSSVCAIGPGLGKSQWAKALLDAALSAQKTMIVDADALNLLAEKPVYYERWVLTPHPGEAARLLQCPVAGIQQNRFKAVVELQQKFGGVVVLKGTGTLIADGQTITVSNTGNPGMASGGMGDLLTGIIAALIGQGWSLFDAAITAVYIHGKAADRAAVDGERGLLATDLLIHLRQLLNQS